MEGGAWLFVHKVPFTLKEHVKTTKTDKSRFSLLKKMLHDKQLFNKVPFQSTKYRKKEFCVDNIKTIGDVFCSTCRNEKCVYLPTNKRTRFNDCKKCKACCNVLNIPFKDQKLTIMLFGDDGTHCFARKTSRDYEKEKPAPFLRKFLRQSQPGTSEPELKKVKMSPDMEQRYAFPIDWWFEQHIPFPNRFIQFESTVNLHPTYTKSSWPSQSQTTESNGLSILDPTLLLLQ